jgi:hypothetical protein
MTWFIVSFSRHEIFYVSCRWTSCVSVFVSHSVFECPQFLTMYMIYCGSVLSYIIRGIVCAVFVQCGGKNQ